jgi:hypothetical protein
VSSVCRANRQGATDFAANDRVGHSASHFDETWTKWVFAMREADSSSYRASRASLLLPQWPVEHLRKLLYEVRFVAEDGFQVRHHAGLGGWQVNALSLEHGLQHEVRLG